MICDVSVEAGMGGVMPLHALPLPLLRLTGTLFALGIPIQSGKMTGLPPLCQELKPENLFVVILKGC